jgi:glucan phosphoethanolaminetransferase (alkaline phosphatase superfamily)
MGPNENNERSESEMYPGQLRAPEEKPKSAIVFGILGIIFGSWGLLGLLMGLIMLLIGPRSEMQRELQLPPYIQLPMLFIGFGLSLFLFITGIRLLKATLAARKAFIVYCVITIIYSPIATVVNAWHTFSKMPALMNAQDSEAARTIMMPVMIMSAVFGLLFSIAYPLVGLIFFTRSSVVSKFKAYNKSWR